ncbi:hypothetical protein H4582DRAFT_2087411 [Lactarius indigo]|nr:hypothetical protein H4582DRAFT_2087411 [Lactarius indigo]
MEQHDRLRADTETIEEQIAQLQTNHAEELESLQGKLQQVAIFLQLTLELEGHLNIVSKQRDADSILIADLQIDKATEELQQTTRKQDDLEILLRQARTELSRTTDTPEDRVRELLEELLTIKTPRVQHAASTSEQRPSPGQPFASTHAVSTGTDRTSPHVNRNPSEPGMKGEYLTGRQKVSRQTQTCAHSFNYEQLNSTTLLLRVIAPISAARERVRRSDAQELSDRSREPQAQIEHPHGELPWGGSAS